MGNCLTIGQKSVLNISACQLLGTKVKVTVSWRKIPQILAFLLVTVSKTSCSSWEKDLLWIFSVQHPGTGAAHGNVA